MNSRAIVIALAALLTFLAMTEVLGVEAHCRCITKQRKRILKLNDTVEVIPPTSHCEETEVIATLKATGKRVCLDPQVPWVKRLIEVLTQRAATTRPTVLV